MKPTSYGDRDQPTGGSAGIVIGAPDGEVVSFGPRQPVRRVGTTHTTVAESDALVAFLRQHDAGSSAGLARSAQQHRRAARSAGQHPHAASVTSADRLAPRCSGTANAAPMWPARASHVAYGARRPGPRIR